GRRRSPGSAPDRRTTSPYRRTGSCRGRPRREPPLQQAEERARGDRERDGADGADDELRREETLDADEDEVAESTLADERGHRDEADGADGRGAHAGEYEREPQ